MTPQSKPNALFYFDTNIIGLLSKTGGDKVLNKLNDEFARKEIARSGQVIQFIPSPALMLEVIGIESIPHPEPPIKIPPKLLKSQDIETIFGYLSTEYRKFLEGKQGLSEQQILTRAEDQKKLLTPIGIELFGEFAGKHFKPGFINGVHDALVWDYVFKFDYPKAVKLALHVSLSATIMDAIDQKINRSSVRVVKKMWDEMHGKNLGNMSPDVRSRINASMKIKSHKDYVDVEMIHYAVVGRHTEHGHRPVHCFTTDNAGKVRDRIFIFKSVIKFLRDEAEEFENKGLKVRFGKSQCQSGFVHICNSSGEIVDTISAEALDEYE